MEVVKMKFKAFVIAFCLIAFSNASLALDLQDVKAAGKVTGKVIKKAVPALGLGFMIWDTVNACEKHACDKEMTFEKGIGVGKEVLRKQVEEYKDLSESLNELYKETSAE